MVTKALEKKKKAVKEIKEKLEKAKLLVVSDYRKFSVKEITDLRKQLYKQNAELRVFKNTLFSRALEEAGLAELQDFLEGPNAVLLGYGDPAAPVKSLVDFLDEIEKGEIKAGILDKSFTDNKTILQIAKLPSREVLIGKVVGGFNAPIYGFVNVLAGTMRKLVYALNAVKEKKEQN